MRPATPPTGCRRLVPGALAVVLLAAGCSGGDGEGAPLPQQAEVVFGPRFVAGPDLFPGAVAQSEALATLARTGIRAPTTCGTAGELDRVLSAEVPSESAGVRLEEREEVEAPRSITVLDIVLDTADQVQTATGLAAELAQVFASGGVSALPTAGLPEGTRGWVTFEGRSATAVVPGGRSALVITWDDAAPVPLEEFVQLVVDAVAQEATCVTSEQDDYCRPADAPRDSLR